MTKQTLDDFIEGLDQDWIDIYRSECESMEGEYSGQIEDFPSNAVCGALPPPPETPKCYANPPKTRCT